MSAAVDDPFHVVPVVAACCVVGLASKDSASPDEHCGVGSVAG